VPPDRTSPFIKDNLKPLNFSWYSSNCCRSCGSRNTVFSKVLWIQGQARNDKDGIFKSLNSTIIDYIYINLYHKSKNFIAG